MTNVPGGNDGARPDAENKKDPSAEPLEDLTEMELEDVAGGGMADTIGVTWTR